MRKKGKGVRRTATRWERLVETGLLTATYLCKILLVATLSGSGTITSGL